MRKFAIGALALLLAVFGALVAARLEETGPAGIMPAMAILPEGGAAYNMLELDLPVTTETAGSALVAELNAYYLTQTPTARTGCTGLWAGKSVILIRAENWRPGASSRGGALDRLRASGAVFTRTYAPDWYQGEDGREFALLTGLMPTAVESMTALAWVSSQGTYLPYALARRLTSMGYTAAAASSPGREAGYAALGFSESSAEEGSDLDRLELALPAGPAERPFLLYCVWTEDRCERTLAWLLSALEERGLEDSAAVCLLTGGDGDMEGGLYLWGGGLGPLEVDTPCSALDVTPTLLDLLGADYDARFLAGRDILATADQPRPSGGDAPLVSLYGSAWSDWVTALGTYSAAEDRFAYPADAFSTAQEAERYARRVKGQVYARYVYTRRAMENNYFRVVLGT